MIRVERQITDLHLWLLPFWRQNFIKKCPVLIFIIFFCSNVRVANVFVLYYPSRRAAHLLFHLPALPTIHCLRSPSRREKHASVVEPLFECSGWLLANFSRNYDSRIVSRLASSVKPMGSVRSAEVGQVSWPWVDLLVL